MQKLVETPWQFGIRHLLVAMFFVATAAGLLAPWLRGWSVGQWFQLVFQAGMTAGGFVIIVGLHGQARQQMLKQVGSERWEMRVGRKHRGLGSYRRGYLLMGTSILLLAGLAMVNSASDEPYLTLGMGLPPALLLGILAAIGACELRFPDDRLVAGDGGIALNHRAFGWKQVALEPPTPNTRTLWTMTTDAGRLTVLLDLEQGRELVNLKQAALASRSATKRQESDRHAAAQDEP